jgi:hypothetical protein
VATTVSTGVEGCAIGGADAWPVCEFLSICGSWK